MKKSTKRSLFLMALSLLSASAMAYERKDELHCYHVIEGSCRSATSNDHIGFVALTWALPAGPNISYDSCTYSIDVQYKFYDLLKNTEEAPTLCRPGDVYRDDIHEYRRSPKFQEALDWYRELARKCMEPANGIEKCVTFEDLDVDTGRGQLRVLLKNR